MIDKRITKRLEDYAAWYQDIITVAELAEHGPSKGSMIIKPYGYAIWENIQKILDKKIAETGAKNVYFPLLIPQSFINKEKEHVEGFSPELAVVTYAGGEKLDESLVIRPTSETVMYDAFSRWIQSHRDLPLMINQWCNIVRWEMRPRLFLRTSEFLWQEGHTVHATQEEALDKTVQMLHLYKSFAEEYLAVPVIIGKKSESEKFAGAGATYAVEALVQDGKAIQMGTSHFLGQNFSKVFNVKFMDQDGHEQYVWQTSWGASTRLIGALIMVHSDDKGLVLPPKIAPIEVVILPVLGAGDNTKILKETEKIAKDLIKKHLRVEIDKREQLSLGARIFEWEKKGVPVRIEIGPRDLANKSVVVARRDTSHKESINMAKLPSHVSELLDKIQKNLFAQAKRFQENSQYKIDNWDKFEETMNTKGGFILAHWCGSSKCEEEIKSKTKATIRCIPIDQKSVAGKCVYCGKESSNKVFFAKAY